MSPRQKEPPLPQCIAWVPARRDYEPPWLGQDREDVPNHRCTYRAHALPDTGVPVCKVHARIRKPKAPKMDPRQIDAFAAMGTA